MTAGSRLSLTAADGHVLGAYEASPVRDPLGGVIVLQEIFGVNAHIRAVCDTLAEAGFAAVAPALFDRYSPDFESGYSAEELAAARPFLKSFEWDHALLDLDAAVAHLKTSCDRVAAVGFCLGGSLAWLAAARGRVDAAVCYYGGQIIGMIDEVPQVSTILHFGREDHTIPLGDVGKIGDRHPTIPTYLYDAGHGFHCDARPSFDPASSALAWERTIDLLQKHIAFSPDSEAVGDPI